MDLFKSKKSVMGLDIGRKGTKIVQLKYQVNGKPILERADYLDVGCHDEAYEGQVKAYLKEHKIGNVMVASSIDDDSMKIRKMGLPKMPDADLIEAIKWNLRDIVDGDVDAFSVHFSRIEEKTEGDGASLDLMAYAIKREVVSDYQAKITSLGLHPFYIEPAAVTLASSLERGCGEEDGFVAGVHIGYGQTLFYVIRNGVFVFSRPLMGINMEIEAKEPDTFNQKLAIEIQKSIDTFKVNFKMQEIRAIHVSGGGALKADVKNYLVANMGVPIEVLDPYVTLANTEAFDGALSPLFVQAVGLAYLQP